MKRFSHKIRKRLSITSKDRNRQRTQSDGHVCNGETSRGQANSTAPDKSMLENATGVAVGPVTNGNNYTKRLSQTPQLDSEHHDYSTLDGEKNTPDNASRRDDLCAHDCTDTAQTSEVIQRRLSESSSQTLVPSQESIPVPIDAVSNGNWPTTVAKRSHSNNSNNSHSLVYEFQLLARKGWYWGPMTREQAEKKLCNLPEASFLVRDSSDDRYLLSLSFRSNHRTLHTRIEHSGMKFSFYEDSPSQAYTSVVELIEKSIRDSNEQGVFCYSRLRLQYTQTYPVRLVHPVSRFTEVRPLQDLCRFVIRQSTRIDHIQNLPLPNQIKGYLNQSYF